MQWGRVSRLRPASWERIGASTCWHRGQEEVTYTTGAARGAKGVSTVQGSGGLSICIQSFHRHKAPPAPPPVSPGPSEGHPTPWGQTQEWPGRVQRRGPWSASRVGDVS